jgi:hypothetical protein
VIDETKCHLCPQPRKATLLGGTRLCGHHERVYGRATRAMRNSMLREAEENMRATGEWAAKYDDSMGALGSRFSLGRTP